MALNEGTLGKSNAIGTVLTPVKDGRRLAVMPPPQNSTVANGVMPYPQPRTADKINFQPSRGRAVARARGWALLQNGDLHTAFYDASGDGVAGETCGIVDIEFLHQFLPMLFHGLDTYF